MDDPAEPALFRQEAVTHQRRALYGEVILKGERSLWLATFALCALIIAMGLALIFIRIDAQAGSLSLWHWLMSLI